MSAGAPSVFRLLTSWNADPATLTALLAAIWLYCSGIRRTSAWPWWRGTSFIAGLLVLAISLLSGIDGYDDRLLSIHMVQHLLLMLLAPVFILAGAPLRLALSATHGARRRALAATIRRLGFLARPVVGWSIYTAVLLGTHLTGLYDLAVRNNTVHAAEHAAYFWSGIVFFAPIVAADPIPHRPGPIGRFVWLTAWMVPMSALGALLNFSQSVRYTIYLAPARALHVSALADQHLAGAVMWAGSAIVLLPLTLWLVIDALLREERRQQRREAHLGAAR